MGSNLFKDFFLIPYIFQYSYEIEHAMKHWVRLPVSSLYPVEEWFRQSL